MHLWVEPVELSMWVVGKTCQCQTSYSAINSCLVLFIGLNELKSEDIRNAGNLTIYSSNK